MPSTVDSPSAASFSASQTSQTSSRQARGNGKRPRSGTARSTTTRNNGGFWIVAIAEGRSLGETGFAALDLRTSSCYLSQFQDSSTYVKTLYKLFTYDPVEVLVSQTTIDPAPSKLVRLIMDQMDVDMVPMPRKSFNSDVGQQFIERYSLPDDQQDLIPDLASKYFALTACAALLSYTESTQGIKFIDGSLHFRWTAPDGTMAIDQVTARSLELVANLSERSRDTLLGVLDRTGTPMGKRVLRMAILQPATDEETIRARLEAVDELTTNEGTFTAIQTSLKSFLDMDHLITSLVQVPTKPSIKLAEQAINHTIALRHVLRSLALVRVAVSTCKSEIPSAVGKVLDDPRLGELEVMIDEAINEDVGFQKSALGIRNQRCYAIKAGFNGLLDVARQTYKETTDDVYNLITSYAEQYGLPLKPHFNPTAGFQIVCPRDLVPHDLPLVFTNLVLRKKQAFFTTLDLKKYNERINESLAEIYLMSDKIVAELLSRARERIGVLYKASDAVALLDLVASFSAYCVLTACVRPEFTDTLAVKNGRHPIKEKISLDPFVPNDCYASSANSFQIVTGPNTSGKTTYLRSIALLQIMAQIGCYVPAEYASFRIADALFSRTCNDDAEELQASTFMIEMREVAHILRNATDRSLIIIDELGRATSTNDGLGISFAVAEALLKSKAFVFFATHFVQLAELLDGYPDVVNLHLSVALENKRGGKAGYKFLYTVKDGSTTEEHYGLRLAEATGLPADVLLRAHEVAVDLKRRIDDAKEKSQGTRLSRKKAACVQLVQRLVQAKKSSTLPEKELVEYLKTLQDSFRKTIKRINGITDDDEDEMSQKSD